MKLKTLMVVVGSGLLLVACAVTNPNAGKPIIDPSSGQTNGVQPAAIVNPKTQAVLDTVNTVNQATSAINPYSSLIGIGLLAAASFFKWQANQKSATLSQLADSVIATGSSSAVVSHAQNFPAGNAVSAVINDKLPVDPTPKV